MKKNIPLYTNLGICIIIILGFLLTSSINHTSNVEMLEEDIEKVSRLTSENIYSKIEALLGQPINVSMTIANDMFLKKWLEEEGKKLNDPAHLQQLQEYLYAYRQKYKYDSVFLVSAQSGRYYHFTGIDRVLTPGIQENDWYYTFVKDPADHNLNVDNDEACQNMVTVFVNCKIKNANNAILGVAGVGLSTDYLQKMLKEYEKDFGIRAFLIDPEGALQVSSQETKFKNRNVFAEKPFSILRGDIIRNKTSKETYWYADGENNGYYVTQYIPTLDWYLIVGKDTTAMNQNFAMQFYKKSFAIVIITLLVLLIISKLIKSYNSTIMKLLSSDSLTGILNRMSYENLLHSYNSKLNENLRLGLGVFDLNGLKAINDSQGHNIGDAYIKNCARVISESFPNCPVFRIGGDEFVVFFKNMDAAALKELHKVFLENIEHYNAYAKILLSIAYGYAFYEHKKDKCLENIFSRADTNMYKKKKEMKERDIISV